MFRLGLRPRQLNQTLFFNICPRLFNPIDQGRVSRVKSYLVLILHTEANGLFWLNITAVYTLFPRRKHGILEPSANCTLLSNSSFHAMTVSKVSSLDKSLTTNAPTASLGYCKIFCDKS